MVWKMVIGGQSVQKNVEMDIENSFLVQFQVIGILSLHGAPLNISTRLLIRNHFNKKLSTNTSKKQFRLEFSKYRSQI